jgi:hypothetical protein
MKAEKPYDTLLSIVRESQPILSIGYLLAVGIGMLFNFQKYARFNINIFEYADIFDFLIAPFADSMIILFTIASIGLAYLAFRADLYWERKYPKSYGRYIRKVGTRRSGMLRPLRYFSFISISPLRSMRKYQ